MENTRLNVYVSQSGLCSRRKADELIKAGEITVNHWAETNPAYQVQEKDTVRHGKIIIKPEPLTYIVMNKPEGYITTMSDEFKRPTIVDLLDSSIKNRVFPVGRLDYNTTGVLLLTNDGDLAQKLAHPSSMIEKIYRVTLKEEVTPEACLKLKTGMYLKDGPARVDSLFQGQDKKIVRITIHSGRNRIIRRMFEALGYTVKRLERTTFATVSAKSVPVGRWRLLEPKEIQKLLDFQPPKKSAKTEALKKRVIAIKKAAARAQNTPAARKRRFAKKAADAKKNETRRKTGPKIGRSPNKRRQGK